MEHFIEKEMKQMNAIMKTMKEITYQEQAVIVRIDIQYNYKTTEYSGQMWLSNGDEWLVDEDTFHIKANK